MRKLTLLSACLFLSISITFAQNESLPVLSWEAYTIKSNQKSAGFIDVSDIDGDGTQEVLLSTLQETGGGFFPAKGALRLFRI